MSDPTDQDREAARALLFAHGRAAMPDLVEVIAFGHADLRTRCETLEAERDEALEDQQHNYDKWNAAAEKCIVRTNERDEARELLKAAEGALKTSTGALDDAERELAEALAQVEAWKRVRGRMRREMEMNRDEHCRMRAALARIKKAKQFPRRRFAVDAAIDDAIALLSGTGTPKETSES